MIMPCLVSSSSMAMLFSLMIYLSMPAAIAESNSDEQVVEQARIGMLKAISLIKDKKFAEAAIELDQSYRTFPSKEALHLLGRLYDKQPNECLRSIATWKRLIQECQEGCELRIDALAKLKESELACEGEFEIETIPPNASIYLNRQLVSKKTPFKVNLMARKYELMVLKEGYRSVESNLVIIRNWHKDKLVVSLQKIKKSRGSNIKTKPFVKSTNQNITIHDLNSDALQVNRKTQETVDGQLLIREMKARLPQDHDPFTRLKSVKSIKTGKISMSGDRSMIAQINCEYLTRVKTYQPLSKCDGMIVNPLDRFYLSILPQQDGYIYVVSSNDKGQWNLVFPTSGEDNLFQANVLKSIPDKEWLLFDLTKNTIEKLSIITSPQKIIALEQERGRTSSQNLPAEVMNYFIPRSVSYEEKLTKAKSSHLLKAKTDSLLDHPQVLHTSFEVYR